MSERTLATLVAASLLGLAGCVTPPDYHRPQPSLEPAFIESGVPTPNATAPGKPLGAFWHNFQDPLLDTLIDQALTANGDLRLARARLREARANLSVAEVDHLPVFSASGDDVRQVTPQYEFPGTSRSFRTFTGIDASFVANWELDLFGRVSSGRAAAVALTESNIADVQAARVSVAAEVARNYLSLRGTQERYRVTLEERDNQLASLKIVQARADAGRATELDLTRAQSLVESTQAQLPLLQTLIDTSIYRLATLTAQSPRALLATLARPAPLPGLPFTDLSTLPVGTPEQWLQRRPDLIAAERQLAAATANVGVARAELYPHVSISGLLGLSASSPGDLLNNQAFRYSIGPSINWTAFDFGRIRGRIRGSEARVDEALASYEQSVRLALEETEGAFTQFARGAQRTGQLAAAAGHADQSARLARLRFEAGVTDFLSVLDAERDALTQRDLLVQSQTDNAAALVAVYRALGGGWDPAAPVDAASEVKPVGAASTAARAVELPAQ